MTLIEFDKNTVQLDSTDAFNKFCDAIEILASVEINKDAARYLLEMIPSDILQHCCDGMIILNSIITKILQERKTMDNIAVKEIDLTTQDGVREYMSRSLNTDDWNRRCNNVKEANGGNYPDFWYTTVISSGLLADLKANWLQ